MTETERDAQLARRIALFNAIQPAWPTFALELERIRADKVAKLVTANDEELRGAIKCIDELLRLPNTLHQEMQRAKEPLPESDGFGGF